MARLLISIGLVFLIGCNSYIQEEKGIVNEDMSSLLSHLFNSTESETDKEVCKKINNQLLLNNDNAYFTSFFDVNADLEQISIGFMELDKLPLINSNHSNQIHLKIDSIQLNDFVLNLSEFDVSQVRRYFETTYPNRFYISIEKGMEEGLRDDKWRILQGLFREINDVSYRSKNEISNREWGKSFNKLSFEEKKQVVEKLKFSVHIYFKSAPQDVD
jgi:hypothetical protein